MYYIDHNVLRSCALPDGDGKHAIEYAESSPADKAIKEQFIQTN